MPTRPKGPCRTQGCYKKSTHGYYCNKHWEAAEAKEKARKQRVEKKRDNPYKHLYGTKGWRKIRDRQLKDEPNCSMCGRRANTVDHVIEHHGEPSLFFDRGNLQSMCTTCHSRKTATYDGGFGNVKRDMV
jgi:5-methylcytosine-specific restriction protein A